MKTMVKMTTLAAAVAVALLVQPVLAEDAQTAPVQNPEFQAHRAQVDAQRAERRAQIEARRAERRAPMEQRREAMRSTMTAERERAQQSMEAERAAMEKVMEAERATFAPVAFTGNPADWQQQQIEAQEQVRQAHEELNRLQAERFQQDERARFEAMGLDYDTMIEQQKAAWEQQQAAMKKFAEEQQKLVSGS